MSRNGLRCKCVSDQDGILVANDGFDRRRDRLLRGSNLRDLLELAKKAKLEVCWQEMDAYSGLLIGNVIVLNSKRSLLTQKVALAHELGHAYYGHTHYGAMKAQPLTHEKAELQADRHAAKILLDAEDVRAVCSAFTDPARCAQELGVPTRILRLWLADHEELLADWMSDECVEW